MKISKDINSIYMNIIDCGIGSLSPTDISYIKKRTYEIITHRSELTEYDLNDMSKIIDITNIIHNETNMDNIISDDEYDTLVEIYKYYYGQTPIGGTEKFRLKEYDKNGKEFNLNHEPITSLFEDVNLDNYIYADTIRPKNERLLRIQPHHDYCNIGDFDRLSVHAQLYPELVGTLNKCKYVLDSKTPPEAINEKIFERDFIADHIMKGIYRPDRILNYCLQLKYDGVSVVATIRDGMIVEARSRGNVESNTAVDLSPILYGYTFDNISKEAKETEMGVKFEAIMTYIDLYNYNMVTGSDYKNCRTAISSIFGRLDGRKFQKFITLVPLDMETGGTYIPRHLMLDFLNANFANTIRSEYIHGVGDTTKILFETNRFLEEARQMRNIANFMYDGIVFSYEDEDIIDKLGRVGSINQYQIAIKFPSLREYTTFVGYSYTIGKDGRITPIINYEPVMFNGTYHTKSSCHSYGRFKELNLAKGDILQVDYVNDVMPYVEKFSSFGNEPEPFITNCPACNNQIKISPSGKTALCDNIHCIGRSIKRLVGFFEALNIKNFNESYILKLDKLYLSGIYNMSEEELSEKFHSIIMAKKFKENLINGLSDRYDYELLGALGFTNIGNSKWRTILYNIPPAKLIELLDTDRLLAFNTISNIKGIGGSTAQTIVDEYPLYEKDMKFLLQLPHKNIASVGYRKSVRFSGVRDTELMNKLNEMGFDASGAGVTKNTDILVVPYDGFTSTKVAKAMSNPNTVVVSIDEMRNNASKYL